VTFAPGRSHRRPLSRIRAGGRSLSGMRCLVTGATGYIGGRLVSRLVDRLLDEGTRCAA
jgi:hypothetical protein